MKGPNREEPVNSEDVHIPPFALNGVLTIPKSAKGIVLFAHGSGSSRFSPRNTYVARALQRASLGTLLFDLLSEEEAETRVNVFDIALLADRLRIAAEWIDREEKTEDLPLSFFGASTGAAAALVASTQTSVKISAIVSRGGRPDLAHPVLKQVRAPTLLIVGGDDEEVLALNHAALAELHCEKDLEVVPGATHLFEEPGTLDEVIGLARLWFLKYLTQHKSGSADVCRP